MGRFGAASEYENEAAEARARGEAELADAIDAAAGFLADVEEECGWLRRVAGDLGAAWDEAWDATWDGAQTVGGKAIVIVPNGSCGWGAGFWPHEDHSGAYLDMWGLGLAFVPSEGKGYFGDGVYWAHQNRSDRDVSGGLHPLSAGGFLDAAMESGRIREGGFGTRAKIFMRLSRADVELDRVELEKHLREELASAAATHAGGLPE